MQIEQPWNDDRLELNGFVFSVGSKEVAEKIIAMNNACLILTPTLQFGLESGALDAPSVIMGDIKRGYEELKKAL